jgi:hypothetical protein
MDFKNHSIMLKTKNKMWNPLARCSRATINCSLHSFGDPSSISTNKNSQKRGLEVLNHAGNAQFRTMMHYPWRSKIGYHRRRAHFARTPSFLPPVREARGVQNLPALRSACTRASARAASSPKGQKRKEVCRAKDFVPAD